MCQSVFSCAQSGLWLCMSCGLQPAKITVHVISQTRILEWAAISFFRESSSAPGIKSMSPAPTGSFFTTVPLHSYIYTQNQNQRLEIGTQQIFV